MFTFNHLADAYMYVYIYIYIYIHMHLHYITFTFNHLADAFIQSDCQMRIEAIKPTKEQQYVSAVTSPVLSDVVHKKIKKIENK